MNTVTKQLAAMAFAALPLITAAAASPSHGAGAIGAQSNGPQSMGPQSPNAAQNKLASTGPVRGPSHTGQPNQSCGSASAPNTPGNAASAPGSAFNPEGNAGTHYAGQQPQNSRNSASVAQYDVACSNQPK
jgi:hypothetical protein